MKSPRKVGIVGSGQLSNTGQQDLGGPEIRGWFSDSIETLGVFQQQGFRTVNTKLNDSAEPKVCGKPRMKGIRWNTPSPWASPVYLLWSVCPLQWLYGVPCKPSFEFPCISLSLASRNLWLSVHYQGNSSFEVGTTSIGYKYKVISLSSALL